MRPMLKQISTFFLAGILSACTVGGGPAPVSTGAGISRANTVIADEFAALMFETENGTRIPRLLKYEAPIRVSLDPALAAYQGDLQAVLGRMRQ